MILAGAAAMMLALPGSRVSHEPWGSTFVALALVGVGLFAIGLSRAHWRGALSSRALRAAVLFSIAMLLATAVLRADWWFVLLLVVAAVGFPIAAFFDQRMRRHP